MHYICLNFAALTKQIIKSISDQLSDTVFHKDVKMIVSIANVSESLASDIAF